jgi:predicted AlkP superfamily phosphohydrolase/phosphomutase
LSDRRVLIIGIDGGTWTVLKPAIDKGHMPFLKSLVDSGVSGILESTLPAITPAAWGTFQTGRNPGANGVYGFTWWDRESKNYLLVNSTSLQPTIWQILSKAGKRVVSLNVPMTYPPQPVNGYVVSGIDTPSLDSLFTYPAEFQEELLRRFPEYHILNLKNIPKKGPRDSKARPFIETLVKTILTRADAACCLLSKGNWDLFMVHFQASDVLQHLFWKYLDPNHPDYEDPMRDYIFSTFYRCLDKQIERICGLFDENGNSMIMVVSDHGFESHRRRFNLGNWLHQEGYLKLNQSVFRNFRTKYVLDRLYNLLEKGLPNKVKIELRKVLIGEHQLIDWSAAKAFSVCSGGEGCIYLLEEDEAARTRTANQIKEKLLRITDPLTAAPIVRSVYFKDELYSGEKKHIMPDMLIETADTYSCTGPFQLKKGLFTSVGSASTIQLGKHHKEGIIIASGSGVQKDASVHLSLVDIVPTLLYYMEVRSPVFLDGNVGLNLFEQSFIETTPALRIDAQSRTAGGAQKDVYSQEEQDLIQERLKSLGYME